MEQLQEALRKTMDALRLWSRKFGNVSRELTKSRTQLEQLMNMNELLYQEEMLWLQRLQIDWLNEGDRNTKFFHSKAVWRARKSKIRELVDSIGVVHSDFASMSNLVKE